MSGLSLLAVPSSDATIFLFKLIRKKKYFETKIEKQKKCLVTTAMLRLARCLTRNGKLATKLHCLLKESHSDDLRRFTEKKHQQPFSAGRQSQDMQNRRQIYRPRSGD